ncbi:MULTISPECIES: hypothetical protein [unclassified Aeromicrobium]|nr:MULTISPECIES: hypothetical protein [unclassified Aeromicrobium]
MSALLPEAVTTRESGEPWEVAVIAVIAALIGGITYWRKKNKRR